MHYVQLIMHIRQYVSKLCIANCQANIERRICPKVLSAMCKQLWFDIQAAFDDSSNDTDIKVIIIKKS